MSSNRARFGSKGIVATCAAVTLILAACSSSSKSSSGAPTSASGGSSSTAAPASVAGGGANSTAGITPTSVTIGQLADVSGPVPGLFRGAEDGLAAWAAYANSKGGVDGRKVKVDFVDAALNCTTYTNGIKSLVGKTFALVGTFSLVDGCGEATLKSNPGVVDLQASNLNPTLDSIPNIFDAEPIQPGDASTVYQYVKDKFGSQAIQHAASLWGSTEQFAYNEQKTAMQSIGYKIIYNRGFSPLETNYTADILRMKNEGVQVVDETDDAVGNLVDFLKQSQQQNFHPVAVISSTGYDSTFFKLLGDPSLAKNVVMYQPNAMYLGQDSKNVPEINVMTQWLHKVHPGGTLDLFGVEGWVSGLLFGEAMQKAGANPTRTSLLAAIKSITSFNGNGLLPTVNPGQKVPGVCEVIIKAQGTNYVRTDPPNSGFDCNGKFVPYTGSGA